METASNSKVIFFNKIDEILRNGQDGQTIGLPVGTDSSRVLAEVISSSIDQSFQKANPKQTFFRHVDDVWFGARSDNRARTILAKYRVHLRDFELDINDLKTKIRPFSSSTSDEWPQQLRSLLNEFKDAPTLERKIDIFVRYYSYAFHAANKENDEGVIKYAIKLLDTNELWNESEIWPYLERFLASCAMNFSHSLDYVSQVMSWRNIVGGDFDKKLWSRIFNSIIIENASRQNDHEVAWALWGCWELKIKVLKSPLEAEFNFCGDVPVILARHIYKKKQFTKKPDISFSPNLDPSSSLSAHWLLLHEAKINGWLKKTHNFQFDHGFLQDLRNKKISFFDPSARPPVFLETEQETDPTDGEALVLPKRALPRRSSGYDDIDDDIDEDFEIDPDFTF